MTAEQIANIKALAERLRGGGNTPLHNPCVAAIDSLLADNDRLRTDLAKCNERIAELESRERWGAAP